MQKFILQRIIKLTFTVFLITLIWNSLILASEHYELADEWGSYGEGDGQFIEPIGIAIDKKGNLYVSDPSKNNRVQKFTSDGEFITKWGSYGSGDGEFRDPWGIDIDSEGNVYVADMHNDRIQKFTSNGDFITKWSTEVEGIWQYSEPQGVAVDNAGNVYVQHISLTPPALYYGCIQKFTSEGILIKQWIFMWALAFEIATDSEGNIYVPSSFFGQVQKFNPNGELIDGWSTCSIGEAFCTSTGIALDSEDNVYVSDMIHHCIKKFTPAGELITKWELQGSGGFGSPPSPWGLGVDNEGYVYVADGSNSCVQKYVKVSATTTTTITIPCLSERIYGSYSEQIKLLRCFRDNILSKTPEGQEIIRLYYEWSPAIVKAMEEDEEFSKEVREMIDGILLMIREEVE